MIAIYKEKILEPLVHMIYPHLCAGCESDLLEQNELVCYKCISSLPHTHFASIENNPVEKIFWGRVDIAAAMSEFYFTKDSVVQNLVYELKYRDNKAIGIYLGEMIGESILGSDRFKNIDAIIPIPLYKSREKKRGYNQAALLANGISKIINIPSIENNVIRTRATDTQTKKHRRDRWENVSGGFAIKNPKVLEQKHLLLVDDVLTTGATLEACAIEIFKIPGVKISIAVLALARE